MTEAARAAAACAFCGACQAVCPLYRATRQEDVSARGKLRLIAGLAKGWIKPGRAVAQALDACLLCGRCSQKCPNQTPATEGQRAAREVLAPFAGGVSAQPLFLDEILPHPGRMDALARAGHLAAPLWSGLPLRLPGLAGLEKLPRPAAQPFLHDAPRLVPGPKGAPTAALFVGCLANYLRPELAAKAVELLARRFNVVIPPGQGCCGLMAQSAGQVEPARRLAALNARALAETGAQVIVTACASCAHAIKDAWPRLLADDPEAEAAARLAQRAREICGVLAESGAPPRALSGQAAALHIPCHQSIGLADGDAPGRLLAKAGVELAAMDGADQCCGGGGLFSLHCPELSQAVFAPRQAAFERGGATILATSCSGCQVQWRRGLPASVEVIHPIELLR